MNVQYNMAAQKFVVLQVNQISVREILEDLKLPPLQGFSVLFLTTQSVTRSIIQNERATDVSVY